jgi:hypothetical protein
MYFSYPNKKMKHLYSATLLPAIMSFQYIILCVGLDMYREWKKMEFPKEYGI